MHNPQRLRAALALAAVLLGLTCAAHAEPATWSSDTYVIWPLNDDRPAQTAVVSWSDWMVFDHATFDTPGVRFVINKMAASGIRGLWWRTFGGGWALYSSKVPGVTTGNYAGQGADYSQYDSLADAVDYGHKLGLKVYAWYTPLEEAHGWPDNVRSHYVDAHPEQWDVTATGAKVQVPSFYYDDYRRYKLDLAREMITRYDVDGLVIDFERGGAPVRNDNFGYIPAIVAAFHRETGLDAKKLDAHDPRWQRFRARYVGKFMRDLRRMIDALDRDVELVMMFPAGKPLTAHWDAPGWAKEGLVDRFVLAAHGSEGWGSPSERAASLARQHADLGKPTSVVIYSHRTDRDTLRQRATAAAQDGVDELVWFETTYLHFHDTYDVPRSLAAPTAATLVSPPVDLAGGGALQVLAAGGWEMSYEGEAAPFASGKADEVTSVTLPRRDGPQRLVIRCELEPGAQRAGVAIEGWATDANGSRQPVRTDATWTSATPEAQQIVTVAQPGVPPFLGDVFSSHGDTGGAK